MKENSCLKEMNSDQKKFYTKHVSDQANQTVHQPGLDWTRLFMSLTAGAGTRCMSLLPQSPTLWWRWKKTTRGPRLGYQVNNVWIPKEKKKRKESKQPDNQGLQIL